MHNEAVSISVFIVSLAVILFGIFAFAWYVYVKDGSDR